MPLLNCKRQKIKGLQGCRKKVRLIHVYFLAAAFLRVTMSQYRTDERKIGDKGECVLLIDKNKSILR
jgi:hypothetical protein